MAVRYEPRRLLEKPHLFGRRPDALWVAYDDADRATVAAAYMQHLVACQVRDRIAEDDERLAEIAARAGTTRDTLLRKLTGATPARLDDIYALVFAYGDLTILPAPDSLDALLPPVG